MPGVEFISALWYGVRYRIGVASKPLRSRLYTNAAFLSAGELAFSVSGVLFWIIAARLYTAEAVGLAGTTITSAVILAQVAQLGLGHTLIRYIPELNATQQRLIISRSLVTVALASLVVGPVFILTLPIWSADLKDLLWQNPIYFVGFLLFVLISTFSLILRFVLIGYRRSNFAMWQRLILGLSRLPMVGLLAISGIAIGIVLSFASAMLLSVVVVVGLVAAKFKAPLKSLPQIDIWKLGPLLPTAASNLMSHILTALAWQLLPLVVISIEGPANAGFFYIGWAMAGVVIIVTQQLALSLLAEGSYEREGFHRIAKGALLAGASLGGIFAVLVLLLGDFILLLFGQQYVEQSGVVLKLLAAAAPLAAAVNIFLGIERVREHLGSLIAVSTVVAVTMIGVTVLLVPRIGLAGAGYGVLAGYGVGALLGLILLVPVLRNEGDSAAIAGP